MKEESRFAAGPLPALTDERVVEVRDGVVVKKEVDGSVFIRKRNLMSRRWFWEEEGTPGCCSPSSERYWAM
jgi:hypothetical protein